MSPKVWRHLWEKRSRNEHIPPPSTCETLFETKHGATFRPSSAPRTAWDTKSLGGLPPHPCIVQYAIQMLTEDWGKGVK